MKKLLAAMFVALLMVVYGEDTKKAAEDGSESNQSTAEPLDAKAAQVGKIDLDDPATRNRIIAEATRELQARDKPDGSYLHYLPRKQTPYTGWHAVFHNNGQAKYLARIKAGKLCWLTEWYENGQKESEEKFKDGKGDGLFAEWYGNGQKRFEHNYKEGKKAGLGTSWYENGQKEFETNYKDGKYDGLLTEWYENGQKRFEHNYKEGKKAGLGTSWYENGQKKSEESYKDGKSVTALVWKPNGEKCPATNLVNGNGVVVGYAENGQKKFEENYKDGQLNGLGTGWHPSGQKQGEGNFKNGKRNGLWTFWYENGQKREEGNFKEDKEDGAWIHYLEDGTEDFRITYKDGEKIYEALPALVPLSPANPTDETIEDIERIINTLENTPLVAPEVFRVEETPDRKTAQVGKIDFDDPKTLNKIIAEAIVFFKLEYRGKEGERLVYASNQQTPYTGWGKGGIYRNGPIGFLTQWKSGKKDGVSIEWYGNGQKKSEVTYKDGKLMVAVAWKPNGEKCPVTNLRDGNGVRVVYEGNGAVSQRENYNYKDGLQHGTIIFYNHDGTERYRDNYKDGVKVGSIYYRYYSNGQKRWRETYKDGKLMVAVAWKPNGEKCPVTKIDKDGNGVRVHYHESGQKEEEVNYKDGLRHGPMISYNHDGTESWRENYEDGVKVGSITFNPDGTESWRDNYKDGVKVGSINYRYYSNRQKKSEVTERNGKTMTVIAWKPNGEKCPVTKIDKDGNGVEVWYNPDGTEGGRFTYKDGEKLYEPLLLLENLPNPIDYDLKNPDRIIHFKPLVVPEVVRVEEIRDRKTAQVGKIDLDDPKTLNEILAKAIDGNKLKKGDKEGEKVAYAPNQETPYTGWAKEIYANGQREMLLHLKNGKQDGLMAMWYENGQKKLVISFKEGKQDGPQTSWHENGQKRTWDQYKDGKLHGLATLWYENGRKKQEATYKDGKQDGFMNRWYEDGRKKGNASYKNGKLDGLMMLWYGNGQKRLKRTFENGKLITAVAWKLNGRKCPVTNIVNGNGISVWYNPDGTEKDRTTYKDGERVED